MSRKISFILASLGLIASSTAIYAHTPKSFDNALAVTIPNTTPGLEFSVTALALRPSASNLNYTIYNQELPTQSPTWIEKEIKPNFGGAFGIGARYVFCGGKDINLYWTHLNTSTSTKITAPNADFFLGPDYEIGPDAIIIRHATGNAAFKYDVVNLDTGQRVDFGKYVEMRFFAGISSASLREEVHARYSGTKPIPFAGPFSNKQKVSSRFNGIGPRFGFEADMATDYGFGFVAQGALSTLIGATKAKTNYISNSPQLLALFGQTLNYQTIEDKKIAQVVPALDGKLGVYYKTLIANCMEAGLEAGWQAAVYMNAIQQYLPGTLVGSAAVTSLSTGGIFVGTMNHTQSNYSVQGPYLTATLKL